MQRQLRISPPRLLGCLERFGAQIKTHWLFQYQLGGNLEPGPGDTEKVSETDDLGRNFYPRFWVTCFCILARLRKVLRTKKEKFGTNLVSRSFKQGKKSERENRKLNRHGGRNSESQSCHAKVIPHGDSELRFGFLASERFGLHYGAKHSPQSGQNAETCDPKSPMKIST